MRKHTLWIASAAFVTGLTFGTVNKDIAADETTQAVVRISDGGSKTIQQVSHHILPGHELFSHVSRFGNQILFRHPTTSCGCSQCANHSYHGHSGHYIYKDRGPLRNMILLDNSRTYSAGHGWARPTPRSIMRNPVEYQRYWPTKWYGQPGGGVSANAQRYPSVYMPTDTTQLGYYYQVVPQWRPNPGMIPQAPWPPNWHARECPADGCHQVTIGKIGDRRHHGPPQTPHYTVPPTPEEDNTVPPIPSQGEKSASIDALESESVSESVSELEPFFEPIVLD